MSNMHVICYAPFFHNILSYTGIPKRLNHFESYWDNQITYELIFCIYLHIIKQYNDDNDEYYDGDDDNNQLTRNEIV